MAITAKVELMAGKTVIAVFATITFIANCAMVVLLSVISAVSVIIAKPLLVFVAITTIMEGRLIMTIRSSMAVIQRFLLKIYERGAENILIRLCFCVREQELSKNLDTNIFLILRENIPSCFAN